MKKMKLFPKAFLYVFSLMASITLISHALFFFCIPIVYTGQKEAAFRDAKARLTEGLMEASSPADNSSGWQSPVHSSDAGMLLAYEPTGNLDEDTATNSVPMWLFA